ncbi:uncharacterized protein LOC117124817 [Anneissia japonica]|uniref:uncharacterized protein LOC117124817 n=1 Tax=Anneissia japonica TaxID=1529436 RepID=UPI001425A4C9|nr:uncharacterized protein LOC117124817 [Anneissia japonica]
MPMPDEWTFFAVTFNGFLRQMTVWRNSEIVHTVNTSFSTIDMNVTDIKFAEDPTVHMKLSRIQIYNRVLTEAEMKTAEERGPVVHQRINRLISSKEKELSGVILISFNVESVTRCAAFCNHDLECTGFVYNNDLCCLSNKIELQSLPTHIILILFSMKYYTSV